MEVVHERDATFKKEEQLSTHSDMQETFICNFLLLETNCPNGVASLGRETKRQEAWMRGCRLSCSAMKNVDYARDRHTF